MSTFSKISLRVCLVEWILGRMEKKGEKIKKGKLFGKYLVGWERWENEGIFSPGPLKSFFPKM